MLASNANDQGRRGSRAALIKKMTKGSIPSLPFGGFALSVLWIPRRQLAELAEQAARASSLNVPTNQIDIPGRVLMATVAVQIPICVYVFVCMCVGVQHSKRLD